MAKNKYQEKMGNAMWERHESKAFDVVSWIMEYEDGSLDEEGIINGFQHLIDNGMAWTLQGHYGRMARDLIAMGYCTKKEGI